MEIVYKSILPSKDEFFDLFETTGWNSYVQASADELARAIAVSDFIVTAYCGERLVGFGRVLTDGILHAMVYDMIVHPDYQRRGIGTQILQQLVKWCNVAQIRSIQLFCAHGKRSFYEKNGFVARHDDAPGMQYLRQAGSHPTMIWLNKIQTLSTERNDSRVKNFLSGGK